MRHVVLTRDPLNKVLIPIN